MSSGATTCQKRSASTAALQADNAVAKRQEVDNAETCGPVPLKRFLEMWRDVEKDDGWDTEDFENSGAFRRANTEVNGEDTKHQATAQYGRVLFPGTQLLFEKVMGLKWFHRFCDIGHGIGNNVFQAAYVFGCESLGIELVGFRNERAMVYQEKLREIDELHNRKRDGKHYAIGPIRMRHGSLLAPEHRQFLTADVDVAFCNNFGGVFGERAKKLGQLYTLDHYLAGLFCLMKEGAVLVTFYPLPLPPSRDETNAMRKRAGLAESDEASFYQVEEYHISGSGLLSWTNKPFVAYKYTRLSGSGFLCCNPACEAAKTSQRISSYKTVGDEVLVNFCDCKVERTTRRSAKYECPRHYIHHDANDDES